MKITITGLAFLAIFSQSPSLVMNSAKADSSVLSEDSSRVSSFCRERLGVLKSAYRQAESEAQRGNTTNSAAILEKGLRDANLQINPHFANTLTSKAIRRGITLLENLKATQEDRQKVRTINNFLFNVMSLEF